MTRKRTRRGGTAAGEGLIEALPYTRISGSERQKEGLSLDSQVADTRRYAGDRGWGIGREFQDVMSGKRDDRPEYLELLQEVRRLRESGRQPVVVVKWLHRLGRRLAESVRAREELKALGVPVHSVQEGGEVSDFLANIMASVAQYEVEQLGERVSEVAQYSRSNGWHVAGAKPWGYRLAPATEEQRRQGAQKKVLEVVPEEAPYVAEAFRRAAGGEGVRSIAAWTASLPEVARGGRKLTLATMQGLLRRAVYVARHDLDDPDQTAQDAEAVLAQPECRWPALTDDATWRRAQERFLSQHRLPRQASQRYLLTGFLRCPDPACGSRMVGRLQKGKTPRYACVAAAEGTCGRTATAPAVEGDVVAQVSATLAVVAGAADDPAMRAALRRQWREIQTPRYATEALAAVRRHEAARGRARKHLGDAAVKLVAGELDKTGYGLAKARFEADLAQAEEQLARLRAEAGRAKTEEVPDLDAVLAEVGGWRAAVESFDLTSQRAVLAFLVARVRPVRVGHGAYRAEIDWTPAGEAVRALVGASASREGATEAAG